MDIGAKFLAQPQPRLGTLLDLLWTFLDESALCDVLEHCIVRECLLFDLVSPVRNMKLVLFPFVTVFLLNSNSAGANIERALENVSHFQLLLKFSLKTT